MNHIFDLLFSQYSEYETIDIWLEIIAVIFGCFSVWFSKQNKIWVFPTGIVSTLIFVYLLSKWKLLGDMMINAYYFIMSVYGWYIWTRKDDDTHTTPISRTTVKEKYFSIGIFISTLFFVYLVYLLAPLWTNWATFINSITTLNWATYTNSIKTAIWTTHTDSFTSAIFFVGMWLMAKRKIENWIFWIIGDLISVPLYLYKGLTFSSFQYFGFTFIAIFGYLSWKKILDNKKQTS